MEKDRVTSLYLFACITCLSSIGPRIPTKHISNTHSYILRTRKACENGHLGELSSFGLIHSLRKLGQCNSFHSAKSGVNFYVQKHSSHEFLHISSRLTWFKPGFMLIGKRKRVRVATVRKNPHKRHCRIRDSAKRTMLDDDGLVYPHLADLLNCPFSGLLTRVQAWNWQLVLIPDYPT